MKLARVLHVEVHCVDTTYIYETFHDCQAPQAECKLLERTPACKTNSNRLLSIRAAAEQVHAAALHATA